MCLITVFTPTFNRAALLNRVFESLRQQTFKNFEWIIVDDGSTDNTKHKVDAFIANGDFKINYIFQENKGKHFAINNGVHNANGKLFFILDSDDELPENALAIVAQNYELLKDKPLAGGLAGRKAYLDGQLIGSQIKLGNAQFMSVFEFRYQLNFEGDMCEVFYTNVLKEFPFPEIKGEKFCPEALVWNRIGTKYKLLWIDDIVYKAEYQPEGLTSKIFEIRKKAPVATTICYSELAKGPIPFKQKFRATINYWRFAFYLKQTFFQQLKQVNFGTSIFAFPIAFLMFLNDKRK